jgi:hypothetical protein
VRRVPVFVDDLATLSGPTGGVIGLPHRLLWRPDRTVDLDQPWQVRLMYEAVLTEAARIWDQLYLPRGVRQAWEDRHPALRSARAAA